MFRKLTEGIVINTSPFSVVIFSRFAANTILKYIQNDNMKPESGGLLLGYRHGNNFEITKVTVPQSKDIQKKVYFERNDSNHLSIFSMLRKHSNRKISFLGEWHTHPESNPTPSLLDLKEWQKTKKNNNESLVFCIIGIENIYFSYY